MEEMSLAEFQRVTRLSDAALMWLLRSNRLPGRIDPSAGFQVALESLDIEPLISAALQSEERSSQARRSLLAARLTRVISENLEEIAQRAVTAFLGSRPFQRGQS